MEILLILVGNFTHLKYKADEGICTIYRLQNRLSFVAHFQEIGIFSKVAKTFHTSLMFLCSFDADILGRYRESHLDALKERPI